MRKRWNDLLFAHWPIPANTLSPLLPEGIQIDTFQGSAWLGVAPSWTERIKLRGLPSILGVGGYPSLSLRTYVCDQHTGTTGIFVLSEDASNLIAVASARFFRHLPSHWADMRLDQKSEREFFVYSRRLFSAEPVIFMARYRGLGPTRKLAENRYGTLEYFLTERHCMFTSNRAGQLFRANIHYITWPLEDAEAVIECNDLATALGIKLPEQKPVLHYARQLAVYIWPTELVESMQGVRPVAVAVSPWG